MNILCFDIGGTAIKSATIKDDVLANFCEHSYSEVNRSGVLARIYHIAGKNKPFDAIAISTAGLVDTKHGKIIFCSEAIPGYTGTELKKILEEKYNTPVFVLNDVNAAALGEAYFGAGREHNDFICLTFGTSIGGAIVINRNVYEGASGYAGEFGHMATHTGGKSCVCGGCGCYGTYASTQTLVHKCHDVYADINDGRQVFEYFARGEQTIHKIVDEWCEEIILGLVMIVHIFNPSCIVLGGGIMAEEYVSGYIRTELPTRVMEGYRGVQVLAAQCGNRAGLMGAARWAMENME